eukprot:180344_1
MVFGLTDKLKKYLEKKNVHPADVPKVLIAFKACYFATWMLTIPVCARFQPLYRFFKRPGPRAFKQRLINRYPTQYEWCHNHTMKASDWFGNLRIIRWIPESFGQRRKDFGIATAEAYVLIHLLYPFWGTVEFLLIVRYFQRKRQQIPTLQEISDSYEQSWKLGMFEWIKEGIYDEEEEESNDENK